MNTELIDTLTVGNTTKIVFLILDGLGGIPLPGHDKTELEAAATPNFDALAKKSICGLLDPVGYGITPGSGPAHFALFGYDPLKNNVGRGLLEASGINFPMTERDLLIRLNFATIDNNGLIIDRRAGRINTETGKRICKKLQDNIQLSSRTEIFFEAVKEHRGLVALRGDNLQEDIIETDPEVIGKPPITPAALSPQARETAEILKELTEKAKEVLSDEKKANMILLRGFAKYKPFKTFQERFKVNPLSIANYPMYRGITRLLGMNLHAVTDSIEDEFTSLQENYKKYDFFYLHIKPTDSRGEDGQFDEKVKVIEEVDLLLPRIIDLNPDVLVVTGDHSTPSALSSHSWHPVPVIISAQTCRPDSVERFGEQDCIHGGLGRIPMVHLMALTLAHAKRMMKFGA